MFDNIFTACVGKRKNGTLENTTSPIGLLSENKIKMITLNFEIKEE